MSIYSDGFDNVNSENEDDDASKYMLNDLQLAAELGKNLLVRNKELETDLRNSQNIIDEQTQEIEYLQKQTAALREVTNSRCRIYEHMEVGIQDLERANHRLKVENASDKKSIKSIMNTNEALETRNDELVKSLEETNKLLALERRRNERLSSDRNYDKVDGAVLRSRQDNNYPNNHDVDNVDGGFDPTTVGGSANYSFEFQLSDNKSSSLKSSNNANSTQISDNLNDDDLHNNLSHIENEEIIRFVEELEKNKKDLQMEQQKNIELEEQIITLIQENQSLQDKISQTSLQEEMKSVHDELSILDDVRQGRMCTRCLRSVDDRTTNLDENSSIAPTEDDDDVGSLMDLEQDTQLYRSALTIKNLQKPNMLDLHADCPSPNPYRDLVEKYEALMEVQRHSLPSLHRKSLTNNCNNVGGGISLSEEFQLSGEFNTLNMIQHSKIINGQEQQQDENNTLDVDNKSTTSTNIIIVSGGSDGGNSNNNIDNSSLRRTPTEFSEAGTSSSGFSDVTSNKSTQTDDRPGYFLCSIGDGEDCKFSIYDDASPIDSRFRQRPEYRELFKEIFEVLRKAAEKKAEGEKLPLLDDDTNIQQQQQQQQLQQHYQNKVPPVTPANEELPLLLDFCGDDTQSIISSVMSEQSVAMSECITKVERKIAKKHIIEKNQENKPPTIGNSILSINNDTTTTGSTATINSITATTPINNCKQRQQIIENGRILTPLKREPLEYLTVGVGIKKKNRKKNRNNFNNSSDRSDSPILPSPPRIYFGGGSGKKRRDMRPLNESPLAATSSSQQQQQQQQSNTTTPTRGWSPRANGTMTHEWNGNSMIIYNRNNTPTTATATGKNGKILDMSSVQYRRTVSQDLHILKKLDLSYAEVLRRTDPCKHHRRK